MPGLAAAAALAELDTREERNRARTRVRLPRSRADVRPGVSRRAAVAVAR